MDWSLRSRTSNPGSTKIDWSPRSPTSSPGSSNPAARRRALDSGEHFAVSQRDAEPGGRRSAVEGPGATIDAVPEAAENRVSRHSDTPVISRSGENPRDRGMFVWLH
jgi:hypothetical protein